MIKEKELNERLNKMDEAKDIFCEILDVLEGGDRALDFEDDCVTATTIRIIAKMAGDALGGLDAHQNLLEALYKSNIKEMMK